MGYKLDKEEKELLKAFKAGKLKPSPNAEAMKKEAVLMAKETMKRLRKDTRINIRLQQMDLNDLKWIAQEEGLPYQTLISSILHKYVRAHKEQ